MLEAIPSFCGPGSTLTDTATGAPLLGADFPAPQVPTTSSSWLLLPSQTLVCNIGNTGPESTQTVAIDTKVRAEVPNGTDIPAHVTIQTDDVPAPVVSNTVTAEVTARAQYDMQKSPYYHSPNQGTIYADTRLCSYDATISCQLTQYPIIITVPAGGKGNSPAPSISFTDNLTPESFFGAAYTAAVAAGTWDPEWAPRLATASTTVLVPANYGVPGSAIGESCSQCHQCRSQLWRCLDCGLHRTGGVHPVGPRPHRADLSDELGGRRAVGRHFYPYRRECLRHGGVSGCGDSGDGCHRG